MPVSPLPLILAGPILRRVEPDSVSVWLALSADVGVKLKVLEAAPPNTFRGETSWEHPRKLGANLYVIVVTLAVSQTLENTKVYQYDLWFDTIAAIQTLSTLVPGIGIGGGLPSFVLPPSNVENLLLLHGSCRKPHGPGADALPYAEALLVKSPMDPLQRPQQLFLTGDQIYTDDVADALLMLLHENEEALFGTTPEQVVVDGYPNPIPVTMANFPAGRRQDLVSDGNKALSKRLKHPSKGRLSSTEAHSHLISFREFCTMYLMAWSDVLWPKPWTPVRTPAGPSILATELTTDPKTIKERDEQFQDDADSVARFAGVLTGVRRVLANIPTYMIFDDHEITDDWYIFRKWRDQILQLSNLQPGASLGRAILRNGLAAYAMFQGWGNDPRYFETDPIGSAVLDAIEEYAKAPGASPMESAVEALVGMRAGATARWHYTVTGACHHVIVLDTRTRRSWAEDDSPPRLIDVAGMADQIQAATTPVDVTIVVSAAPVLGVAIMESLFQEPFGIIESKSFRKTTRRIGADYEAWPFDDVAFEALLKKLVPLLPHLVLLSGDVHYSFSSFLTYWQSQVQKGRMVQLTSSALKNHMPLHVDREGFTWWERTSRAVKGFLTDELTKYALAYNMTSAARIGWDAPPPGLLGPAVPYFYDRLRKITPVLIPTLEKITDRTQLIDVVIYILGQIPWHGDWSWRWHLAFDTRDDDDSAVEQRPNSVRPQPLTNELSLDDVLKPYENALLRFIRHELQGVPRTLLFNNSIGRISFSRDTNAKLAVRHALLAFDGPKLIAPVAHTIPFDASAEEEPNIL